MYYPLEIKQSYNFLFKATGILGLGYNNATVMAVMDYDSAKLVNDVTAIHAQVYPELSVGTSRNAADLAYVKVKISTGQIRVFAMDWLAGAPVVNTARTIRVDIENVAISNLPLLSDILVQSGYSKFTITVL